ncbi:hypothetical protein IE077_003800, partial [Cardiosporidium cionae]
SARTFVEKIEIKNEFVTFITLFYYFSVGCNVIWDSYPIAIGDTLSSLMTFLSAAGIVGYVAHKTRNRFEDVVSMTVKNYSFVIYPVGFQFSGSVENTLYILYYGGTAILICASIAICFQVILDSIVDTKLCYQMKRQRFSLPLAILLFIVSLSVATRNGRLIVQFLEFYFGDLARITFAWLISVIVGWFCGFHLQVEAVGIETVLVFNCVCWLGILLGAFLTVSALSIPYLYWLLLRIAIFAIALLLALFVGPRVNGKTPECVKRLHPIWRVLPQSLPKK